MQKEDCSHFSAHTTLPAGSFHIVKMTPRSSALLDIFFKDPCLLEIIESAIIDKNEDTYPSKCEQDKGAWSFKLEVAVYVSTLRVATKAYV